MPPMMSHASTSCAFLIACLLSAVGAAPRLHAETVGSPASILKKGQWVFGLSGGSVAERKLVGGGSPSLKLLMHRLVHFRGYGLTNWLSVYGKVGAAYMEAKIPQEPILTKENGRFDLNRLFGGQVKIKMWHNQKRDLEWDGSLQYLDVRARHKNDDEGQWQELQLATSVAKGFGRVKPYLGVKLSLVDLDFILRNNGQTIRQASARSDSTVGPFFGMDVYFGQFEDVVLNVEVASVDGAEVDLSMQYSF